MKLKEYIEKIEQIKKEITDCNNLIKLYSDKKENLQKEYEKMLEREVCN